MTIVKARKLENSVVIPLPVDLAIAEGQEFYVWRENEGSITLLPKVEDYFLTADSETFSGIEADDLMNRYQPRGAEWED